MAHDSRAVANLILDIADQLRLPLTHMAVHKVAYYGHGWHLAKTEAPLIKQEFEAWKDGPVQRLVWDCFRSSGRMPVTSRATRQDIFSDETVEVREAFTVEERNLLREIVAGYGHLHAYELSRMTHAPGGPWDRVWNAPAGQVTLGMRITHEAIRDHFIQHSTQSHPS